jgi:hypothetical protein
VSTACQIQSLHDLVIGQLHIWDRRHVSLQQCYHLSRSGCTAQVAGRRTVPVEVGSHYLEEGWGTRLMTLTDFIEAMGEQGMHVRFCRALRCGTTRRP